MKKLIAMVMTAAMVASLVPATAFAGGDVSASAKIVDALELTKDEAKLKSKIDETNYGTKVPELQLKITNADYRKTEPNDKTVEVTLDLDNADWLAAGESSDAKIKAAFEDLVHFNLVKREAIVTETKWKIPPTSPSGQRFYTDASNGDEVHGTKYWAAKEVTTGADIKNTADQKELIEYLTQTLGGTLEVNDHPSGDIIITKDGATIKVWDSTANSGAGDWDATYGKAQLEADLNAKDVKITITDGEDEISLTADFANTDYGKNNIVDNSTLDDYEITSLNQIKAFEIKNGLTINSLNEAEQEEVVAGGSTPSATSITKKCTKYDDDEVTFEFTGEFAVDDIIIIDLESMLDKTGINRQALVSVSGDLGDFDDLVYVSVLSRGITASTKKLTTIAVEEEEENVKDIVIKSVVGNFTPNQVIELRLNNGFEFVEGKLVDNTEAKEGFAWQNVDENYAEIKLAADFEGNKITISEGSCTIEATTAKADAVCTMTVKAFNSTAKVEVAKVVDYVVELSVDEDEDVPVIYSGVNVNNYGITDDSDHLSLEVTAEETFPGAWSMRKGFNFELPEGVYVTDVQVNDADNFYQTTNKVRSDAEESEWADALWVAYRDGDHKNFEIAKRTFDDVDTELMDEPATVSFQLELVADPTFVGDVTLKLTGDLVDEQEVTIAKFVAPYTVKAEQNDMKIDYRYTDVPTDIVITEAEAGLWDKDNATFALAVEKEKYITFDGDPTFTVDSNSGMKIKDEKAKDGKILFTVDKESSEPATITISDMKLFLDRTVPAGPYDLDMDTTMNAYYRAEVLFAADAASGATYKTRGSYGLTLGWDGDKAFAGTDRDTDTTNKKDTYVDDVTDYDKTVKEAFVNIVTAGREQDDASFTTKVVVPVGENKIVAGETEYTIDAPAYINANGYTMLPVRAVAVALGINNNNVLWDQATKTVTILYGQRIITMQVGASVVYVNGAALPASSSVEITNNRTFLGLRDLATALGVTDITWDASTKTATLNGGNTAE